MCSSLDFLFSMCLLYREDAARNLGYSLRQLLLMRYRITKKQKQKITNKKKQKSTKIDVIVTCYCKTWSWFNSFGFDLLSVTLSSYGPTETWIICFFRIFLTTSSQSIIVNISLNNNSSDTSNTSNLYFFSFLCYKRRLQTLNLVVFYRIMKERSKEEVKVKDRSPRERSHRVRIIIK